LRIVAQSMSAIGWLRIYRICHEVLELNAVEIVADVLQRRAKAEGCRRNRYSWILVLPP
jgi:hypothetical protein